jgi:IMP cyclohydrolase
LRWRVDPVRSRHVGGAVGRVASDTDFVSSPPVELASLSGYPGRGVVLYRPGAGGVRWLYFLTGRSASSKARRFVDRTASLTVAPNEPGAEHDELRHYACVTEVAGTDQIVIGNGDHVSHIAGSLQSGTPLREAIALLEPEPDPPINTPRIAAVLDEHEGWIVTVRRDAGRTERRVDSVFLEPDDGLVLHTYRGSSDPPIGSAPQFRFRIQSEQPLPDLVWQALHPDYRVMLAAGSVGSAKPDRLLP